MSSFPSLCASDNTVNSVPKFCSTFFNASRASTFASFRNVALDSYSNNQFYRQECIPVGCVPSAAVAVCWGGQCLPTRGVWPGGCLPRRGLSAQGGVCPGGVSARGNVWQTLPLWTEFLTHACESITFPQLHLWTVINSARKGFSLLIGGFLLAGNTFWEAPNDIMILCIWHVYIFSLTW